jgi:hypothetical protein
MSVPESKEATVTIELEMETAKAILRYFFHKWNGTRERSYLALR